MNDDSVGPHQWVGFAWINKTPVERGFSIFGLASITKPVATGTAFAVCVDDGLLSFDQSIRQAIPGLSGEGIDGITVRQWATHTSGFSNAKYHQKAQGDEMLNLMLTVVKLFLR